MIHIFKSSIYDLKLFSNGSNEQLRELDLFSMGSNEETIRGSLVKTYNNKQKGSNKHVDENLELPYPSSNSFFSVLG